ncbi:uncharacterized protein LOC123879581 isoform X2 [Maniola jurtina]|uniref:uncharacterized protein LOC123879581 isoform X2 n=1 Tax=Maniola jurtina TaxID=191418 RepID=UPI001E68DBF8|nr:uncharacterized protein LOC123879581 isoform X2 [Maniola jurtina]
MSEKDFEMAKKKPEEPPPRRRPKIIVIPKRTPSIVIPPKLPVFITPDKTTCVKCPCFPKEDPYDKNKKLNPCLISPVTLYELAAVVVDSLPYPNAFDWSEDDVVRWMAEEVGLPQYKECILDNHINGRRLLMLEDPSKLAEINIRDFVHMQAITSAIRRVFHIEYVRFARSIGLPPRKPLTHCTWFKSRTGPNWGIRVNWTRCDILRWMKIIMPEPFKLDHWDLVWYQKPDFPKVKFARIPERPIYEREKIPHYRPPAESDTCREYLAPRKFKLQTSISDNQQYIWMCAPIELKKEQKKEKEEKKKKRRLTVPKETRLMPKKISLTGLSGKEFILARRKMATPKFLPVPKRSKGLK